MTTRATVKLIEIESLLTASRQRVRRAVVNLRQETGGYSSTTPGNGSPGGGKGGRSTAHLEERPGRRLAPVLVDVDPNGIDVPCTAVERQALGLAGRDVAAERLAELDRYARAAANDLGRAMHLVGLRLIVSTDALHEPEHLVVLALQRAAALRHVADVHDGPAWDAIIGHAIDAADPAALAVFHLCQTWGYDPRRPQVRKEAAHVLAVDLTERWCTSHLRIGVKRDRSRGELCDWCYRNGPLLVATWAAPPRELVQLREDQGKVYAHQIEPFIRAERDRQRNRGQVRNA